MYAEKRYGMGRRIEPGHRIASSGQKEQGPKRTRPNHPTFPSTWFISHGEILIQKASSPVCKLSKYGFIYFLSSCQTLYASVEFMNWWDTMRFLSQEQVY